MTKWQTTDHGQYVEVMPQTDAREHLAGDECWCSPEVERRPGSRPLISHNEVSELVATDNQSQVEPLKSAQSDPKRKANT